MALVANRSRRRFTFLTEGEPDVHVRWRSTQMVESEHFMEGPKIRMGLIRFSVIDTGSSVEKSQFLMTNDDSSDQIHLITQNMADKWNLTTPHLVLSVISNDKYFKPWRQKEAMNDFQNGLMKAASLTNMWILTDGRNVGMTTIIGQGVAREKSKREFVEREQNLVRFLTPDVLPPIIVIGMVSKLALGNALDLTQMDDVIEDLDSVLHPSITHFLILDDQTSPNTSYNIFASHLEKRLTDAVGKPRHYLQRLGSDASLQVELTSTPLVGLLTNSGPSELDRVIRLLKRDIPVIVLHGDGTVEDLLAFAVSAVEDSLYSDMYVRSELLRRLHVMYPEEFGDDVGRNVFRDKILQCVSLATQTDFNLITLVNKNNATPSLRDLHKIILKAVLEAQKRGPKETGIDHVLRNLQLTIDWMNAELAAQEIFKKYNLATFIVADELFEQALLRPNREEFVELFLDYGFILHRYLHHERLAMLFEQCYDKNFFIGVCLEGILGVRLTDENYISKTFISNRSSQLNDLIFILTGIESLIDPWQLTLNASKSVGEDKREAEQCALHALVFWAALTNRTKLTKKLWSRSSQPMALGLVLSTLYRRLSKYWVSEFDLQKELVANGVTFGRLAVQLLDFTYRESISQALFALTMQLADFKGHTAIDIATMGKNKYFIAHPCCQRYLYNLWYGPMRIRRSRRWNQGVLSDHIKIILCLLLVFPALTWIDLPESKEHQEDDVDKVDTFSGDRQANICTKLYHLWTAPVSKFWTTQVCYFIFLFLFAHTLMMPLCGDIYWNIVLMGFLLAHFLDQIYIGVLERWKYRNVRIYNTTPPMLVYLVTLILILVFRVIGVSSAWFSIVTVKILLCFTFVYFSYLAMLGLFPVSQTLGPLLVSVTVMTRKDLMTWTRIWFLIMVSGSVTVFAVIYPAHPFGWELLYKAFLRGIFALFTVQIESRSDCTCFYDDVSDYGCKANDLLDVEGCPYHSTWGQAITLQYIFITKLVFSTLVFAICSVTLSHTYAKAVEIWKYRFCLMVIHYVRRPVLPVPFIIFTYPLILINCCFTLMQHYCLPFCPCCKTGKENLPKEEFETWKVFIQMQKKEEQMKKDERELPIHIEERLVTFDSDVKSERRQMDDLKDRLMGALSSQTSVLLLLEKMRHKLEILGAIKKDLGKDVKHFHSNCRNSLYPGTTLYRSVVFDKNVPWEEAFGSYDPLVYSRPLDDYSEGVRPYVDPDIFQLKGLQEGLVRTEDIEEDGSAVQVSPFFPSYNKVVRTEPESGEAYNEDRTTFYETDAGVFEYALDSTGVPQNPVGRTGVRGRGNLWRWGPNHVILAVITRWYRDNTTRADTKGLLAVEGKGVLEVLVVPDALLCENVLPGGFVTGRTSKYSVLCEEFMKDVLNHEDVAGSDQFDLDDMTQFVISDFHLLGLLARTDATSFKAGLIYQGYMDDRNNTDNAWVEAEIWHFHYEKDSFNRRIPERERHWLKVTPRMQLTNCQIAHVLEAAAKIL